MTKREVLYNVADQLLLIKNDLGIQFQLNKNTDNQTEFLHMHAPLLVALGTVAAGCKDIGRWCDRYEEESNLELHTKNGRDG